MLRKASATLFKNPGGQRVAGFGEICQIFADPGKVGLDKLVVAEGEQPESVLHAEVLENHLFDAFRGMRWFGSLKPKDQQLFTRSFSLGTNLATRLSQQQRPCLDCGQRLDNAERTNLALASAKLTSHETVLYSIKL